jgi:diguanylate cyclase (GGDEF)-like protein/PAS domain S-box-containing protein
MKDKRTNKPSNALKSYRSLVENISDYAIFVLDKIGRVVSWNKGARLQLGYTWKEIVGKPFSIFYTRKDSNAGTPTVHLAETKSFGRYVEERRFVKKDGKKYWGNSVLTSTLNKKGVHQGFSMIMKDVTEQKNLHNIILHSSTHDYLTGLPNRKVFEENFLEAIKNNRKGNLVAILFLDFNNFKHINDQEGHSFGDRVLVQIGARLAKGIRITDLVARLGGDEFVILAPGFGNIKEIEDFVEKVLTIFHTPLTIGKKSVNTSVSIGVAIYPTDAKKASQLLHFSDMALYEAKKQGGNQSWFYNKI